MERKYLFEQQLDRMLSLFAKRGVNCVVTEEELSEHFPAEEIAKMLSVLEHLKLIKPFSVQFKPNDPPTVFPHLRSVTPAGINFMVSTNFVQKSKRERKERRRFDFEFFKIGFDTVIAIISILISLFSLLFSLLK